MSIVVRLSDEPANKAALEEAIAEARRRGTGMVLVSHVPTPRNHQAAGRYQEEHAQVEAATQAAAQRIQRLGVDCVAHVPPAPADAAEAVLDAAREHDATLVVVGVRRRSPVGKAILGSVSQDILLGADCPVLAVKAPGH